MMMMTSRSDFDFPRNSGLIKLSASRYWRIIWEENHPVNFEYLLHAPRNGRVVFRTKRENSSPEGFVMDVRANRALCVFLFFKIVYTVGIFIFSDVFASEKLE